MIRLLDHTPCLYLEKLPTSWWYQQKCHQQDLTVRKYIKTWPRVFPKLYDNNVEWLATKRCDRRHTDPFSCIIVPMSPRRPFSKSIRDACRSKSFMLYHASHDFNRSLMRSSDGTWLLWNSTSRLILMIEMCSKNTTNKFATRCENCVWKRLKSGLYRSKRKR